MISEPETVIPGDLLQLDSPDTGIATYGYDSGGNRTSFANAAGTQAYLYAPGSHYLASIDAIARGYDAAASTTSSHHLGTPRAVIEPARDGAVWTWDLKGEAFGDSPPNEDPDGDSVTFTLDMRFPGQRYDAASGLSYNYFRDYEANVGRYVQSDPVGLWAGTNTYAYVAGNPITYADPLGLDWRGTLWQGTGGEGPASGVVATAYLTSDCINGEMADAQVEIVGWAPSISLLPVGVVVSNIVLKGGSIMTVEPSDLEGPVRGMQIGGAIGGGVSFGYLDIGKTSITGGSALSAQEGFDLSASLIRGRAFVSKQSTYKCGCGK